MAKSGPPRMTWRITLTAGGKGFPPYAVVLRRAQARPSHVGRESFAADRGSEIKPQVESLPSVTVPKFLGKDGRGERIRTSGLHVPNVALYQAKLHPV